MTQLVNPAALARHLRDDERVLWSQTARPLALLPGSVFLLLFCAVWCSFAMLAFVGVWGQTLSRHTGQTVDFGSLAPAAPLLAMVSLFALFGVVILAAAVVQIVDCWRTAYVLTNKRLLILTGNAAETHSGASFTPSKVSGGPNRGYISFAYGPVGRRGVDYTRTLVSVDDPQRVYRLIEATLLSEGQP